LPIVNRRRGRHPRLLDWRLTTLRGSVREFSVVGAVSLSVTPAVVLRTNMPQCHRPRQRKSVLARPVEITAAFAGR
jgi:hypothetical protein